MEILDFDPFALEAIYQDREPGPYDVIEPLPKAVNDWKNRLHPTTKKATKLVDISWQKNMGTIILDSFEFHVHGWTTSTVKRREALDKADTRDHAKSLFTIDRNGALRTAGAALLALRTPYGARDTQNAMAAQDAALLVTQATAITDAVADAANPIVEENRAALTSYCELSQVELQIFDEYGPRVRQGTMPFRVRDCDAPDPSCPQRRPYPSQHRRRGYEVGRLPQIVARPYDRRSLQQRPHVVPLEASRRRSHHFPLDC